MKYLLVKVLLETDRPCYCDLLLSATDNLEAVHKKILESFEFEGKQMASFYEIDEDWDVIEEFPFAAIDPNYDGKLMLDINLGSLLQNPGDQLLYVYDYLNEWKFVLECIELKEITEPQSTPILLKKFGKMPNESEKDLSGEDAERILMNALLGDELDDDFDEQDDWDSDSFDSIDDYEEYL